MESIDLLRRAGLLSESGAVLSYQLKDSQRLSADIYQNAELNATLQRLFGDRELTYSDFKMFYECIDVYGLTESVALMAAEHVIHTNKAKNRVPMSYVREKAKQWAKEGVNTISGAAAKMAEGQWDGARETLKKLGISRAATEEELRLYEKWTLEWGFSESAIDAALPETIKARYPTFGYLDKILEGFYEKRLIGSQEIQEHLQGRGKLDGKIKAVMKALRMPRLTVSQDLRDLYQGWRDKGFSHDMIVYGAKNAAVRGDFSFESLGVLLEDWRKRGYAAPKDVQQAIRAWQAETQAVQEMLDRAGIQKPIAGGDIAKYQKFSQTLAMPHEVILFAAERAYGRPAPINAMDAMLTRWHGLGVHTVQEAQEADSAFKNRGKLESDFNERDYSNVKFYDPLSELEDEDG